MAKQNFLSGGFYGKLGQVVGQRWKNQRILRAWVKPEDPKTPLQQEQRRNFGSAVVYAQAANMSNYESNWFDNPSMSRWNVRMSTARKLIEQFTTFLARIPLIPEDIEPPFPVSQIKYSQDTTTHDVQFILNSEFPEGKRRISIYATNNPNTKNPDDILLLVAENEEKYWKRFNVQNVENFVFDNNTHVRVVSNDETNSRLLGFVSNEQTGSKAFVERYPLELSIYKILVDNRQIQFIFNEKKLEQYTEASLDGFEAYVGGVKQLINITPTSFSSNPEYDNRLCIVYPNNWGVTEQDIMFNSSCVLKNLTWTERQITSSPQFFMPPTDITLKQAEYEVSDYFNIQIEKVVTSGQYLYVTFKEKIKSGDTVVFDTANWSYTYSNKDGNTQSQSVPISNLSHFVVTGEDTVTLAIKKPLNFDSSFESGNTLTVGGIKWASQGSFTTGTSEIKNVTYDGGSVELYSMVPSDERICYFDEDIISFIWEWESKVERLDEYVELNNVPMSNPKTIELTNGSDANVNDDCSVAMTVYEQTPGEYWLELEFDMSVDMNPSSQTIAENKTVFFYPRNGFVGSAEKDIYGNGSKWGIYCSSQFRCTTQFGG